PGAAVAAATESGSGGTRLRPRGEGTPSYGGFRHRSLPVGLGRRRPADSFHAGTTPSRRANHVSSKHQTPQESLRSRGRRASVGSTRSDGVASALLATEPHRIHGRTPTRAQNGVDVRFDASTDALRTAFATVCALALLASCAGSNAPGGASGGVTSPDT